MITWLRRVADRRWWLAALMRDHVRLIVATVIGILVLGQGLLYEAQSDLLMIFNATRVVFAGTCLALTTVMFARTRYRRRPAVGPPTRIE